MVVLVLLASHALCDAHRASAPCCSGEPSRACRLYALLLCGPAALGGARLGGMDASAGILTLGKREAEEQHYHSRLHQLLRGGGGGGGAAGILTMGKRSEEEEEEEEEALLMQWAQEDFTA